MLMIQKASVISKARSQRNIQFAFASWRSRFLKRQVAEKNKSEVLEKSKKRMLETVFKSWRLAVGGNVFRNAIQNNRKRLPLF